MAVYSATVNESQFQLLRGAGFVAAVLFAVALQRLSPHAQLRGSRSVNASLWLINLIVAGALCGACACTVARWAARNGIGFLNAMPATPWLGLPITIVTLDLVSYCWHRANHRVRFLWRFHQVHHSDPDFTASTGVRFHPGELLLSLPVRLTAVAAVGASPEAVALFEVLFAVANFVEHGDIDLPLRFERVVGRVFVTPALHRRHHTKRSPDRDTNFGTIFATWDAALRTRAENDSAAAIETGLPGVGALRLREVLTMPVRRMPYAPH
jgi:sterol desaturase/sphingolipid hydroxylase (fatty acid hydroxylase superfamily)